MIKSIISKVVGRNQPKVRASIFDTPISFRTVEPDVKLSFDKWSKKFKVSSSFTLLEDSEWLQKIRKTNHIKFVENNQQIIYLIKNPWE